MYVHAADIWHTAACPDGTAAGAGGADVSHRNKVCFLQEPAPHGRYWMGHATQKALWGKHTNIHPIQWLTGQFKSTGNVILCVLYVTITVQMMSAKN